MVPEVTLIGAYGVACHASVPGGALPSDPDRRQARSFAREASRTGLDAALKRMTSKRLTSTWWFRIPFIYWLVGTLVYPPVYDHPPGSGYVRRRVWMWDFIGDDWNATALFDVGTVLYQLCFLACLAWVLRAIGTPIVRRLRPAGSQTDGPG